MLDHGNISMFACYAPTNSASDDQKNEFYSKLQDVVGRVAKHDVIGDLNAVLGSSNEGFETCMGKM